MGDFWSAIGQDIFTLLNALQDFFFPQKNVFTFTECIYIYIVVIPQGPEEICLSLEHQNPSKTSEIMGYFDRVDDRVTVSLHILYTANQETEGSQDRLTV